MWGIRGGAGKRRSDCSGSFWSISELADLISGRAREVLGANLKHCHRFGAAPASSRELLGAQASSGMLLISGATDMRSSVNWDAPAIAENSVSLQISAASAGGFWEPLESFPIGFVGSSGLRRCLLGCANSMFSDTLFGADELSKFHVESTQNRVRIDPE